MSRKHKVLFIFTANLIVLSLLFLIAEACLRLTQPRKDLRDETSPRYRPNPCASWADVDAYCAFRPRPGLYNRGRKTTEKTVSEHGFISTPPIDRAKPPNTIRAVFLGGSSTAGTGNNLADQDTWPWETVRLLRNQLSQGKEIDFINAAAGGYASFESYGRLWSRLRFFDPDVVVVYHGWNELSYLRAGRVNKIHRRHVLSDGSWSFDRHGEPFRLYEPLPIDNWISWSQVLTRVRLRLTPPHEGEIGTGAEDKINLARSWDRRGLDVWRTNLRLIRELAKIMGWELFVAKQATLIAPQLSQEDRERCRVELHGFDLAAHVDAFHAIYQVIDEEIPADRIIDTTVLSGQPEYFFDHVHPTPKGASEIAKIVAARLGAYLEALSRSETAPTGARAKSGALRAE